MKQRILTLAALAILVAGMNSCSKTSPTNTADQGLSSVVKGKIEALGFSADDAYAVDGGYIVENDIFLTDHDLDNHTCGVQNNLLIAQEEQYRTTNLVNAPRVITVSASGNHNSNILTAVANACTRYNNQNLLLTFNYIGGNGGGDINITVVNGGSFIASAGFPTGGNPYGTVQFNRQYRNWSNATLTSVFAHEMGHCIGFRHTDYMNRAYSCGTGGNEGDGGVGAINIPGTPTGPDAGSWMLACIGNGVDRPFNANDIIALDYLY